MASQGSISADILIKHEQILSMNVLRRKDFYILLKRDRDNRPKNQVQGIESFSSEFDSLHDTASQGRRDFALGRLYVSAQCADRIIHRTIPA